MSLVARRRLSTAFQTQAERITDAIEQIYRGRIRADKEELLHLIKQCKHERAVPEGRRLFQFVEASIYRNDRYVLNLLMDMFSKFGQMAEVRQIFNRITEKNEFSWTLIVKAYAQNGHLLESICLFRKLLHEGVDPSDYACSIVLGVCCTLGAASIGRTVHTVILGKGYESDVFVAAGLIHMYNKCGFLSEAREAFDRILVKDRYVYTAMIGGYVQSGECLEALRLFRDMDLDGIKGDDVTFISIIGAYETLAGPGECRLIHECTRQAGVEDNHLVQTALLNMYSKCGCVGDALGVFHKMAVRDKVAWGSTIAACAQHGYGREALHLFKLMELEGIKPDIIVLSSLLDACASIESLVDGRLIHQRILTGGYEQDRVLKAAILNMYAKCGNAANAKQVFDEQLPRDPISWNVLVGSCAKAGLDEEVLENYRRMQVEGVFPTAVTFIVVVAACSHAGFVEEGRVQFHSMIQDFGIEPDVDCYCCMVDLLSRTGELEAAESLMESMPFEPLEAGWTSLLSACGFHRDTERAARLAQKASHATSRTSSHYVLLSNMFTNKEEDDEQLESLQCNS